MFKSGRLFRSITRAAILLNRSQIRHKAQFMDHTTIPAPFSGPPTIIIKSPYSVKVEPIDPVQFGDIKAVVGFLYLETETEEELSPKVKTAFQQDIQYNVRAVMSPSRDYMQVIRGTGGRNSGMYGVRTMGEQGGDQDTCKPAFVGEQEVKEIKKNTIMLKNIKFCLQ